MQRWSYPLTLWFQKKISSSSSIDQLQSFRCNSSSLKQWGFREWHFLLVAIPATITRGQCGARTSFWVTVHVHAAWYEASVNWHGSTATKQVVGAHQASPTYSLQVWEILEMWGQRWGVQGSVEDDAEHRASAAGWKPVRAWLRWYSFNTVPKKMWLVTTLTGQE